MPAAPGRRPAHGSPEDGRAAIGGGEKIGGRWLVSGASVRERLRRAPRRGRRLRPANAWAVLALASGEEAPWVNSKDRRRLGGLVAARSLADLVDRLDDRARVEGFWRRWRST